MAINWPQKNYKLTSMMFINIYFCIISNFATKLAFLQHKFATLMQKFACRPHKVKVYPCGISLTASSNQHMSKEKCCYKSMCIHINIGTFLLLANIVNSLLHVSEMLQHMLTLIVAKATKC